MGQYHGYLHARLLGSDPDNICRQAKYKFNAVIRDNTLSIPALSTRKDIRRNLPFKAYPKSLREDLENLLAKRRAVDFYDESAVARAQSPVTLRNTTARVRQALDAAVSAGHAPDDFKALADLVQVDTLKAAFLEMRRRNDGK